MKIVTLISIAFMLFSGDCITTEQNCQDNKEVNSYTDDEEVYIQGEDYDDYNDEYDDYYMYDKIQEYIEKDDIKSLWEYINHLTPEQQEESEINFTFDKKKTVLSIILEMGRFYLFEHFMEDEIETESWASYFLYGLAQRGDLEGVKFLLSIGANVNVPEANGYTPVIAALENDYMDMVEYLVGQGANLDLMVSDYYPNEYYETPLLFKYYYQNRHSASYYDEEYTLLKRLIEAGANIDFSDGSESLLSKAKYEDIQFVSYLIEHGANVNAKDSEGRTPLFGASLEMAKLLIDNKSEVNAVDNYMRTPLFYALDNYEYDLVRYLIEKGADVNHADSRGFTPLHNVAISNSITQVKILVENGANVHAKDQAGRTPIYYTDGSSRAGHEVVEYLISKGADDTDAGIGGMFNLEFSM